MDKHELALLILKMYKVLEDIPPREWQEYKKQFWRLKEIQQEYVNAGGCLVDLLNK